MRTGVDSCDSGCGLVMAFCDQRDDPLNSMKLQESDNQPRYSELLNDCVLCINF